MAVKAGKSRFSLQTLPAADYPRLTMSQEQLAKLQSRRRSCPRATLGWLSSPLAQQDIPLLT